jgi:hypothetical protein
LVPFSFQREIDHHDSVLFHDADQKNDSDDRDNRKIDFKEEEREQST